jgi:hypothetical protein
MRALGQAGMLGMLPGACSICLEVLWHSLAALRVGTAAMLYVCAQNCRRNSCMSCKATLLHAVVLQLTLTPMCASPHCRAVSSRSSSMCTAA